jgi:hypothetical protein
MIKGSVYWDRKIQECIEDENLKNWVGSVIWWEANCCNRLEFDGVKKMQFNRKWSWFEEKYVDRYNKDSGLVYSELQEALKSIGYWGGLSLRKKDLRNKQKAVKKSHRMVRLECA